MDSEATAEKFLEELPKHSVIHFAGHGRLGSILLFSGPMKRFPPEFEPEEFLVFRKARRTKGDRSTTYMMEEWDLVTDIDILSIPLKKGAFVFLNSCETGMSRYLGGGYFRGLAQAFLRSGASNVVSSLMRLYDANSKEFALFFYERILAGESIATALQSARKKMREIYVVQAYWLPYVHYGSPFESDSIGDTIQK